MATIKSFEEIEAWQKGRVLADGIFKIFLNTPASKDFGLKDQIGRAIGSVMDNIAEGFERGGNREFIQFLSIAKGSAAETQSQLYRVLDRHYIGQEDFDRMCKETLAITRLLGGLIAYLKKSGFKGPKFK